MSILRTLAFSAVVLAALTVASTSIGDTDTPPKKKRVSWANSPDVLTGIKTVNLHLAIRGDVKNAKAGQQWLTTRIEKRLRQSRGRGADRRARRLWRVLPDLPESMVGSWLSAPERRVWDRRIT